MATDTQLEEILRGCTSEFKPYHEISKEADTLTFYFKPDPDYSKRLTEHVTLYLSLETDEIVGCRIKGINGILEDLPNGIHVRHGNVDLWLVFWAFQGCCDEAVRDVIRQLVKAAVKNEMSAATV